MSDLYNAYEKTVEGIAWAIDRFAKFIIVPAITIAVVGATITFFVSLVWWLVTR